MATESAQYRQHGFTLIEMMVTLVVLAILVGIAVPSLNNLMQRNKVVSSSNALLADLAYARTEAVTEGNLVSLCPSSNGTSCTSTAYDQGWMVYSFPASAASTDKAYSTSVTPPATLLRYTQSRAGVSIQATDTNIITFGQQGQLKRSPGTAMIFETCALVGGSAQNIAAVPGLSLNLGEFGKVASSRLAAGASCTPTAP